MKHLTLRFCRRARLLLSRMEEGGQDLVEYALVVALISLAAIVAMSGLAAKISLAYVHIVAKFPASMS
ncbi:MAG: Flp family type IVb pilin [Bryobacteraceae bacterium]